MQYWIVLCLSCLFLGACQQKSDTENAVSAQSAKANTVNVEVTQASLYNGKNKLVYSGVVEAKQSTPLSFKTAGTVVAVLVHEGQYVKKGQLLAKLDAANQQSAYELALQTQLQAQDAYDRMLPMHENGTLPEIQWVEVQTGLSQAKIATDLAKRNIADVELYAPKSGVIGTKDIELGVNILPSVTAFTLLDINSVYVNIPVPENEVSKLKKGQSTEVEIAAIDTRVQGKVELIGVAADLIAHTYPVKILINNSNHQLKPGMVCQAKIDGDNDLKGYLVSNKVLQRDARGGQFVYVLQNEKAEPRAVETIDYVGELALVNGVSEKDVLIISGQHKLSQGASVNVINSNLKN